MKINFKRRPTCSCGAPMLLSRFDGDYDQFNYWECGECNLDGDCQTWAPDKFEDVFELVEGKYKRNPFPEEKEASECKLS